MLITVQEIKAGVFERENSGNDVPEIVGSGAEAKQQSHGSSPELKPISSAVPRLNAKQTH